MVDGSDRQKAPPPVAPAPLLEWALVATFILHGLAMLTMAGLLLPTMPGGPTALDGDRIAILAAHPWRFRLGWLPWQLTAVSDLLLAVALLRTPWIPRFAAWAVLVLTIAAVIPDQGAQFLWITQGIELAQAAVNGGSADTYLRFEKWVFVLTGVWAALLYTLAALGWTACLIGGGAWSRALTWISVATWGTFLVVTVGPLLPEPLTLPGKALAAGNALGFVLLLLWLALAAEQVMRRSRPQPAFGRWAPWRPPGAGLFGRGLAVLANSQFLRRLCRLLPVVEFRSDITEVVYVNYLVPVAQLAALVPPGLSLQQLGPEGRWAMFTFLTYRHGDFGPAFFGPLRRLCGSPVQSNWRIYVRDDRTGKQGVYFVTSAVTTALHSLGARLMAEGMPMHLLSRGRVTRAVDGGMQVVLEPGQGSAPDAQLDLCPSADRTLHGPWAQCFADYAAMLHYTVPQNRALSTLPADLRTVRQEIELGIPITSCEPLSGNIKSQAAAAILGAGADTAAAVCFRVPQVCFRFTGEQHDRWPGEKPRGKSAG